jgi:hypothetical protein
MFGVPRLILCDNGPQYRSKEFKNFSDAYHCKIQYNANYHPRANPTERQNRTIKTMLSMYVNDNHRKWDEQIQKLACAIRTAVQETTKVSPFFVNFGRNMCLSGEDYTNDSLLASENGSQTAEVSRNEGFKRLFSDVKRRLELAGDRNVARYNLRKRNEVYSIGQRVWKKNFVLSDAAKYFTHKLAPKFVGPYIIRRRVSPWTYELQDLNGKVLTGSWNGKDLKPA